MTINEIIKKLFSERWSDDLKNATIDEMRKLLYKKLQDQLKGYWSGHTAYHIMIDGGFLVDSKRIRIEGSQEFKGKELTTLGKRFIESMEKDKI